jgi:hypothetical protein
MGGGNEALGKLVFTYRGTDSAELSQREMESIVVNTEQQSQALASSKKPWSSFTLALPGVARGCSPGRRLFLSCSARYNVSIVVLIVSQKLP